MCEIGVDMQRFLICYEEVRGGLIQSDNVMMHNIMVKFSRNVDGTVNIEYVSTPRGNFPFGCAVQINYTPPDRESLIQFFERRLY